jgi:hypothetical protein
VTDGHRAGREAVERRARERALQPASARDRSKR